VLAAEFDAQVSLADDFTFEGGTVRHGHIHVRDLDLDAAHFDAFLHQTFGAFEVILAFDLVERHGDDMLIGGHACRQDFRNDRIRNDGEAEVDRAGRSGVFQIVHFAEGEHEGKDAFLVVEQDLARLTGLESAEGQGGAGGKSQRVDGGDGVRSEWDGVGVVAEFHAFFLQVGG
jgi:hypothetical protein